jgi:hypothetical protein
LLRAVVILGARAKIEVPMYEGNLDTEEMLDWIRSMDKYFEYEYFDEDKRVRHVVTRLKGKGQGKHCGGMNCRLREEAKENKK